MVSGRGWEALNHTLMISQSLSYIEWFLTEHMLISAKTGTTMEHSNVTTPRTSCHFFLAKPTVNPPMNTPDIKISNLIQSLKVANMSIRFSIHSVSLLIFLYLIILHSHRRHCNTSRVDA